MIFVQQIASVLNSIMSMSGPECSRQNEFGAKAIAISPRMEMLHKQSNYMDVLEH